MAHLDAILAASPTLLKAHLLKESIGHLWGYTYQGVRPAVLERERSGRLKLKGSRLMPYRPSFKMIERHRDGILAYCDKKVSLGYIESSNLKARNVTRRAYGYREKEYYEAQDYPGLYALDGSVPPVESFIQQFVMSLE